MKRAPSIVRGADGNTPAQPGPTRISIGAAPSVPPAAPQFPPQPAPQSLSSRPAPTRLALPGAAQAEAAEHRRPVLKPSVLAGVQQRPFAAAAEELLRLFPDAQPQAVQLAQQQIGAAPLPTAGAPDWMRFGEPQQQRLAQLVRQRLQLAEEPLLRQVPLLLRQLHARMSDLLEALQGGVFRRTPARIWSEAAPEVRLAETRLQQALPQLQSHQALLAELALQTGAAHRQLQALDMAAAWLLERTGDDIHTTLSARAAAILASQALALEQLQLLQLDQDHLQALTAMVQEGVLVRLPAVLAQLAPWGPRLSETQRLLLADVVAEFKAFIERKLPS